MGDCHPLFAFDGEHRVPHAHFKEDLKDTNSFLTSLFTIAHVPAVQKSPRPGSTNVARCPTYFTPEVRTLVTTACSSVCGAAIRMF